MRRYVHGSRTRLPQHKRGYIMGIQAYAYSVVSGRKRIKSYGQFRHYDQATAKMHKVNKGAKKCIARIEYIMPVWRAA